MNIFIVDDSPMMRARLIEMCNEIDGVNVIGAAETAQTAIVAISALKPDVVLLDIRLRSGNGLDVLRTIKSNRPSSVVVVLTNFPYPKYREASLNLGADYFFHKSTEFEKVCDVLTQLSIRN